VKPRVLAEPKLDSLGHETVSAPKGRALDGPPRKARLRFQNALLEHAARSQDLALRRRPSADLAAARARRKLPSSPK